MNGRSLLAYGSMLLALGAMFAMGAKWSAGRWPWEREARETWVREGNLGQYPMYRCMETEERKVWSGVKWQSIGGPRVESKAPARNSDPAEGMLWTFCAAGSLLCYLATERGFMERPALTRAARCLLIWLAVASCWQAYKAGRENPLTAEEFLDGK